MSTFQVPARSPNLNPIKNEFHLEGNQLRKDVIKKNSSKETFEQFCWRIKKGLLNFSPVIISKTIESYQRQML